ncbi:MAG TPA: 1-deoxy-D-xylulose-5-phosphate reductoisomerase [Rhizomicrobium sp.]|nr:1-deoxy-D-xylulose-5-phosphate reductoisomerase [Rhizomicrobium sp.]
MKPLAASRAPAEISELEPILGRHVTVLGSTGSIGLSTLDVIAHAREIYGKDVLPIEALTAQSNVAKLVEQAKLMKPKLAVIGDADRYAELKDALAGTGIDVASGTAGIEQAAMLPAGVVMVAIVGAASLVPALRAVERGATLALANKECIVAAGDVFRRAIDDHGASVVPVDSEHNAVFQVLDASEMHAVERVTLTASGGPFRGWQRERMRAVTPAQAVAHPNWSMGAKISVDSATLMNKGLELIEAHYLFALPPEKLAVLVHPQSVVHCLVSYADGSTLAHLSSPDMRTPIAHALAWPRRIASPSRRLDLAAVGQLTFERPDPDAFPALRLAQDCLRAGGLAPTILNAANEIAVDSFLTKGLGFLDIPRAVEATLEEFANHGHNTSPESLDAVLAADGHARELAGNICRRMVA